MNGHTNSTLPNKLFDYMGYGLPVIVSNATPMERVVNECGCGKVYRDQDEQSLRLAISELLDQGELDACGERARNAYRQTYNWATDEAVLLKDVNRSLA